MPEGNPSKCLKIIPSLSYMFGKGASYTGEKEIGALKYRQAYFVDKGRRQRELLRLRILNTKRTEL